MGRAAFFCFRAIFLWESGYQIGGERNGTKRP